MDLELDRQVSPIRQTRRVAVILLDTNALLWLHREHPRSRPLRETFQRLYLSPASILELQFLVEAGRLRLRGQATVSDLVDDDRWAIDDPPSDRWFMAAVDVGWSRDPFDRLIVAHARLRNWRLATGDAALVGRLGPKAFEL
ncbi:MAG: PIN domain-containing protein [Acidobacteria bacterium]|nr:MAG: PIN domain-containing protein [Acidobacteriota bacterium]